VGLFVLQRPPVGGELIVPGGAPGPKGEKGDRGESGSPGLILSSDGEPISAADRKGDKGLSHEMCMRLGIPSHKYGRFTVCHLFIKILNIIDKSAGIFN